MHRPVTILSSALLLSVLLSACGTASPAASSSSSSQSSTSRTIAKKQIVAAILSDPAGLHQEMSNPNPSPTSVPGLAELFYLADGALTYLDGEYVRHPWLAEDVPSVENGLWKVAPDGHMETTWRIRQGAKWQDGTPVTSDDLRFTLDVYRDRETTVYDVPNLGLVEGIDTRDPQTAVIRWSQPFIDADTLFGAGVTMWLLPKHILEAPFLENKATFLSLPYWREEFIGAGPFKMQSWETGSHATLVANDGYILGRPHIDQIEVRFFTDRGALKAGLLAGTLQIPISTRGLAVEDALDIHDTTQDVKVQLGGLLNGVLPMYPQFIDPDPPIVTNLQFRKALLMGIDRQEMADTINRGLGPVAHSWVQPDRPEGRAIDADLIRYSYDPRAATQMIEGLGYQKGTDGIFQTADGTKLSVQIQTHQQNSFHVPATLSVANAWQQLGVEVQPDILSPAQSLDAKYRVQHPAFLLISMGVLSSPSGSFRRSAIPTQETNFTGGNMARYGTAEIDDLVDRYTRTIPFSERTKVLGDLVHQQMDQVLMLPLFFQGAAYVLGSTHLQNVLAGQVWNAHEWDLDNAGPASS